MIPMFYRSFAYKISRFIGRTVTRVLSEISNYNITNGVMLGNIKVSKKCIIYSILYINIGKFILKYFYDI